MRIYNESIPFEKTFSHRFCSSPLSQQVSRWWDHESYEPSLAHVFVNLSINANVPRMSDLSIRSMHRPQLIRLMRYTLWLCSKRKIISSRDKTYQISPLLGGFKTCFNHVYYPFTRPKKKNVGEKIHRRTAAWSSSTSPQADSGSHGDGLCCPQPRRGWTRSGLHGFCWGNIRWSVQKPWDKMIRKDDHGQITANVGRFVFTWSGNMIDRWHTHDIFEQTR